MTSRTTSTMLYSHKIIMFFTNNFDYQQISQDFMISLLCNKDMGHKFFTNEIYSEHATRIDNFRTYDVVSKKYFQCWTYQVLLIMNLLKKIHCRHPEGLEILIISCSCNIQYTIRSINNLEGGQ